MTAVIPYPMQTNQIYCWDALTTARTMKACGMKINCVVTSPPYYGLRDYGVEGQLGLEPTPDEYVAALVELFAAIRDVLTDDGSVWLNLGDSYAANRGYQVPDNKHVDVGNNKAARVPAGLKPKDLLMIPARVALALQADGWYLRSDIIWAKPNAMPESVTDRPTKSHEHVFLLAKSASYWYDAEAIREPQAVTSQDEALKRAGKYGTGYTNWEDAHGFRGVGGLGENIHFNPNGRNKRDVWTIPTQPFPGAHFAVMPEELVRLCVLAGCPDTVCAVCGAPHVRHVVTNNPSKHAADYDNARDFAGGRTSNPQSSKSLHRDKGGVYSSAVDLGFEPTCACDSGTRPGIVYDPFMGSGTVGLVARKHGRAYVGSEINPDYVAIARERLRLPFEPHYVEKQKANEQEMALFSILTTDE